MELFDVIYRFEHRILPRILYDDSRTFIDILKERPSRIFEMLDYTFEEMEMDNPYDEEDIVVASGPVSEKYGLVVIQYPQPEVETLCYCSIIIYDSEYEYVRYFTVEHSGIGNPRICSWSIARNGGLMHSSHDDYAGSKEWLIEYIISVYEELKDFQM